MDKWNQISFKRRLLNWYRRERRDLPWRRARDPYAILLAEVMLQQTQAGAVAGRYRDFLEQFPSPARLAAARESDVLAAWAGLGYYARARNLRRLATICVENFGGRLPSDPAELAKLPGIGRYTLGAVASIAFGRPLPAVDGNVARVFSRVFAIDQNFAASRAKAEYWRLAEQLLARRVPGDWNQALMELGALVCKPRNPACAVCPVREFCPAFKNNAVGRFPPPRPKPATVEVFETAWIIIHDKRVLLRRNREGEWCKGLWDFPKVTRFNVAGASPVASCKNEAMQSHEQKLPSRQLRGKARGEDAPAAFPATLRVELIQELFQFRYRVTHHRVTRRVLLGSWCGAARLPAPPEYCWQPVGRLAGLLHHSPAQKTWRALEASSRRR